MKRSLSFAALAALVGLAGSVYAQQLAVPGAPVAKDVPGAKELPDPNRMYKVVFDIGKAAPKAEEVSPGLIVIATYVNTLAKYGVPADHRKIAVIRGPEEMFDSAPRWAGTTTVWSRLTRQRKDLRTPPAEIRM